MSRLGELNRDKGPEREEDFSFSTGESSVVVYKTSNFKRNPLLQSEVLWAMRITQ